METHKAPAEVPGASVDDERIRQSIRTAVHRFGPRLIAVAPVAVLAVLAGAAVAPLVPPILAVGAMGLAAGTAQDLLQGTARHLLRGTGQEMLKGTTQNLIANFLADFVGKRGKQRVSALVDAPDGELQAELARELEGKLAADGDQAAALRAELARLLQAVGGVETALDAATDDVKAALAQGLTELGASFEEFRWVLDEVHEAVFQIQRTTAVNLTLTRETLAKVNLLLRRPPTAAVPTRDSAARADAEAPVAGLPDSEPPYKGLESFQPEDAEHFFGRERDVSELVARLAEARFLAIVGSSGSGKSSVLRAGLLPAMWQGAVPGGADWKTLLFQPGRRPVDELAVQLSSLGNLSPGSIASDLRADPGHAVLAGKQALVGDTERTRLFFAVDQFEEIFTLCRDENERSCFIEALLELASEERCPAVVVIGMRADFYGGCATYPRLATALQDHQVLIGPMGLRELREAIERPATIAGLTLEPGLVDQILDDVGDEPGALPLLQHALLETWKRRSGRALTLSGYSEAGGVREAIATTAESLLDRLTPEQRDIARAVFLRLTELGEGSEHTRRRASRAELVSQRDNGEAVETVLSELTDARLVTAGEDSVEVAHEALIREWPTLRRWLDEDREGLRVHRRLSEAAQEWQALEHEPGALYRGARLQSASEWAERHGRELNSLERQFLEASRLAYESELEATRRRNRSLRMLSFGLAALLLIAAISAAAALRQRQRANSKAQLATSASLIQAASNVEDEVDLSLLLSLEAYRARPTLEARSTLLAGLQRSERILQYLRGHRGPVRGVSFSPDGRLLASGDSDGNVVLWDAARRSAIGGSLRIDGGQVDEILFADRGRLLVVRAADAVSVWNVASRRRLRTFRDASSIAVSPTGRTLAVGREDGRVLLWNPEARVADGRRLQKLARPVSALAFSADGAKLAAGDIDGIISISNIGSGRRERILAPEGVPTFVRELAFSPNGRVLASLTGESSVHLWPLAGGGTPRTVNRGTDGPVLAVAFAPDGRTLAYGSGKTIVLWDVARGEPTEQLAGHADTVTDIAFNSNGRQLATAGFDRAAILWSVDGTLSRSLPGRGDPVFAIALGPDRKLVASSGLNAPFVLRDLATGRRLVEQDADDRGPGGSPFGDLQLGTDVAFSPDGRLAVNVAGDGSVTLWDAINRRRSGAPLRDPAGRRARSVAFAPDGGLLAIGTQDGAVVQWDVQSRRSVAQRAEAHHDAVTTLAFSAEGELLASGSDDGSIRLWDRSSLRSIGKPLRASGEPVTDISFNRDGTMLASADSSEVVNLWILDGDRVARSMIGPHPGAGSVAFTPEGDVLASGSSDGRVILWDVERRSQLGRPLEPGAGQIEAVSFSADGRVLAAATEAGSIVLWPAVLWRDIDEARQRICRLVGRNLTRSEWDEFLPGQDYRKTCARWPLDGP